MAARRTHQLDESTPHRGNPRIRPRTMEDAAGFSLLECTGVQLIPTSLDTHRFLRAAPAFNYYYPRWWLNSDATILVTAHRKSLLSILMAVPSSEDDVYSFQIQINDKVLVEDGRMVGAMYVLEEGTRYEVMLDVYRDETANYWGGCHTVAMQIGVMPVDDIADASDTSHCYMKASSWPPSTLASSFNSTYRGQSLFIQQSSVEAQSHVSRFTVDWDFDLHAELF